MSYKIEKRTIITFNQQKNGTNRLTSISHKWKHHYKKTKNGHWWWLVCTISPLPYFWPSAGCALPFSGILVQMTVSAITDFSRMFYNFAKPTQTDPAKNSFFSKKKIRTPAGLLWTGVSGSTHPVTKVKLIYV